MNQSLIQLALKEWAVVCKALDNGEQIILLRKGGIEEARSGFAAEADRFALLATLFHQSPSQVVPKYRAMLSGAQPDPRTMGIDIRSFATVALSHSLSNWEQIARLQGHHLWSEEVLRERFERWNKGVVLLALRVYTLPQAIHLPWSENFGGCKSWAHLETTIDPTGATPVLSDEEFGKRLAELNHSLQP